jgi:hypothetical protein
VTQHPDDSAVDSASSDVLPILSWWGGFFGGPLIGVAAFFRAESGTLGRSHGGSAALFWSVVLVCWAGFILWVMVLDGTDPDRLLIGLPVVLATTIGACINGTVQIRRGRTALGRPLDAVP